jgi:hypothetical protein
MTMITLASIICRVSKFLTLNRILVDSPTLMSNLLSVNSVNLTLGMLEFVYFDIKKTMTAIAIAVDIAATTISFKRNNQNDNISYNRKSYLFGVMCLRTRF